MPQAFHGRLSNVPLKCATMRISKHLMLPASFQNLQMIHLDSEGTTLLPGEVACAAGWGSMHPGYPDAITELLCQQKITWQGNTHFWKDQTVCNNEDSCPIPAILVRRFTQNNSRDSLWWCLCRLAGIQINFHGMWCKYHTKFDKHRIYTSI